MKMKEAEKIVVVKPVAWRPGSSTFRSCPELLTGAVNVSQRATFPETSATAIKSNVQHLNTADGSHLAGAEILGSAASNPFYKIPESKGTSNVVYKPIPQIVSKAAVSLLANLGQESSDPIHQRDVDAQIQQANEVNHHANQASDAEHDFPLSIERNINAPPKHSGNEKKSFLLPDNVDRPAYDGHNWRKYGQKQVKGSEYLRSYYKCTYPSCPVKKKVETTVDGQVAERVYKGEHNHSNLQPLKLIRPEGQMQRSASDGFLNKKYPLWTNQQAERPEGHQNSLDCPNITDALAQSTYSHTTAPLNDPIIAKICNASASTSNSFVQSGDCNEVIETLEVEDGNFKRKRRKGEVHSHKEDITVEAKVAPRLVVQNNADSEIIGDGFRWRKYGQKIVKGNAYPRSYYRCTSPKCNAKKYVERTPEGTSTFITTYEGRHNHDMPVKSTPSEKQ